MSVRLAPVAEDRFLVLNELYHPAWQVRVDGQPARIYAANLVMRGILAPAGATTIELEYVPFLKTPAATAIVVFGVAAIACIFGGVLLASRRFNARSRRVSRSGAAGSSSLTGTAAHPGP